MSRLQLPARKLFMQQIQDSRCVGPHDSINKLHLWQTHINSKSLIYSIVWVQGTVTQNNSEDKKFVLNDGTDFLTVDRSIAVPVVGDMEIGKYLMVVGEVLESKRGVEVKAIKVQDLSADVVAQQMWMDEVLDFQKFVL